MLAVVLAGGVMMWAHGVETGSAPAAPSGAAPSGEGAAIGGATPGDYVIQVDDILTVDDLKARTELNPLRGYRVDKDGTIKLLYLERVQAAGLTKRELEDKIEKLYDPRYFKNLQITIEVASKTFTIGGEVNSPGIKPLVPRMNIQAAIASAGWFTDYARKSKVIVRRLEEGKSVVHVIDVDDIIAGNAAADFLIKPNDDIYVPRKGMF